MRLTRKYSRRLSLKAPLGLLSRAAWLSEISTVIVSPSVYAALSVDTAIWIGPADVTVTIPLAEPESPPPGLPLLSALIVKGYTPGQ